MLLAVWDSFSYKNILKFNSPIVFKSYATCEFSTIFIDKNIKIAINIILIFIFILCYNVNNLASRRSFYETALTKIEW